VLVAGAAATSAVAAAHIQVLKLAPQAVAVAEATWFPLVALRL
jgi:hypothetical protein